MFKTTKKKLKLALYLAIFIIGLVLLLLPENFFNSGESICLSVVFFDIECYGCGMTRAIQHLIHFDFDQAWEFNKLSFVVFPLFIYLISSDFFKFLKEEKKLK